MTMWLQSITILLLITNTIAESEDLKVSHSIYYEDLCATLFCRKGETCVITAGSVAKCDCKETCKQASSRETCGTDGQLYPSRCELYRQACLLKQRVEPVDAAYCQQQQHPMANETLEEENITVAAEIHLETTGETTILSTSTTKATVVCSEEDFSFLLNNLLLYYHAKYAENLNGGLEHGKNYLVNLMFSHFDTNSDHLVELAELLEIERQGHLTQLEPIGCRLSLIVSHADKNSDGLVNKDEFAAVFGIPTQYSNTPSRAIANRYHFAYLNTQYQLVCNLPTTSDRPKINWYRFSKQLTNGQPKLKYQVSPTGYLYLTPVDYAHTGNFTCTTSDNPNMSELHIVQVLAKPKLKVSSDFTVARTRETVRLYCQLLDGSHPVKLSWRKVGSSTKIANGRMLLLKNATLNDTGSYTCVAVNIAGQSNITATVLISDDYGKEEEKLLKGLSSKDMLAVLHNTGVDLIAVDKGCETERKIFVQNPDEPLCGHNKQCSWGDAVITEPPRFMYATLPDRKVLVVFHVGNGTISQIFHLNHRPQRLWYLSWEDSVWLESWHDLDGSARTIQVIRAASHDQSHSTTHAFPLETEFDTVENIFMPTEAIAYGYITRPKQLGLVKVDLHSLAEVSQISLTSFDCHPESVTILKLAATAVVECRHLGTGEATGQLVIDYMSDAILHVYPDIHGSPLATPDLKSLLNVELSIGRLLIQQINRTELTLISTVDGFLPLVDLTFADTPDGDEFGLYAISSASENLFLLNLPGGKMTSVAKVGQMPHSRYPTAKRLASKSTDSQYLAVGTDKNLVVVDLHSQHYRQICRLANLEGIDVVVWAK